MWEARLCVARVNGRAQTLAFILRNQGRSLLSGLLRAVDIKVGRIIERDLWSPHRGRQRLCVARWPDGSVDITFGQAGLHNFANQSATAAVDLNAASNVSRRRACLAAGGCSIPASVAGLHGFDLMGGLIQTVANST